MILDSLQQARIYFSLHPRFPRAFEFLVQTDLLKLADGTQEIEGQEIYAVIARQQAEPEPHVILEAHRRYIDIQYTVEGAFDIGWRSLNTCYTILQEYDEEKDFMLFSDEPESRFILRAGNFGVFFPEDAHAPIAPKEFVHKVVVKVAV